MPISVLMRCCSAPATAARSAGLVARRQLAQHLHLVERALARDHQLVLPRQLAVLEHQLLDLRGEDVDAADDQHVVAAADDLAHAAHAARGGRQQPRQVARAVADHRQRLLGQRGEDQLAFLAVGQHRAGLGVDDLGVEMVLPDHRAVLGLDAFAGHARAHHFAQAVDVHRVQPGAHLDVVAHRLGPRLGAEDADLQRAGARVQALAHHLLDDHLHVARRDHDDVGPEVGDQLHLLLGLAAATSGSPCSPAARRRSARPARR